MGAFLNILLFAAVLALPEYRYGGTFIGGMICSDGIVVASDSRTTFLESTGRAFGYLDGMQKIYVDQGAAVAVSGLTNLGGELFSSFVQRNDYLLTRPVHEILFGFLVWLPFQNSNAVGLMSAGFVEGKPMICAKSPVDEQHCTTSGYFINKDSPVIRDTVAKIGRMPNSAEAAAALKAAIEEYSKIDQSVGGPISILKLTPTAPPQWLENKPSDGGFKQICDVVKAHRNGQLRIVPLGNAQELTRHLNSVCA